MSTDGRIIGVAKVIAAERYPAAEAVFAAGSIVRGQATPYSDLDLVVVQPRLPAAYRESFKFDGYPVEAFVHDAETLEYFFLDGDRPSGVPSLTQMVLEGIEVPVSTASSERLKQRAADVLAGGPPPSTNRPDGGCVTSSPTFSTTCEHRDRRTSG